MNRDTKNVPTMLTGNDYAVSSVFEPAKLLPEARRQKDARQALAFFDKSAHSG
jgi:hypothetical protein